MKDFKSWPRHFLFVKESLTFRLSEYELLDFIIVMITSFLKILLLPSVLLLNSLCVNSESFLALFKHSGLPPGDLCNLPSFFLDCCIPDIPKAHELVIYYPTI